MGLALLETLLFPVLALNIAIIWVFRLVPMAIPEARHPGFVIPATLIICGVLDFFLIRWAWRKANADRLKRTSRKAICSFVLGFLCLLSATYVWFCFGTQEVLVPVLVFIPTVILGVMALKDVKSKREHLTGRGLAIVGILFGAIALLTVAGRSIYPGIPGLMEGSIVGSELRQALHLSDTQVQSMNKVFQDASRQYKILESQHMQEPVIEKGQLIVNVTAFPEFETRVWTQLADILDDNQWAICRGKLDISGLMPFAREGGRIKIWRYPDLTYYWEMKYGNKTTSSGPDHGMELPEGFKASWEKAGMDR